MFFSQMRFDTVRYSIMASSLLCWLWAVYCHLGLQQSCSSPPPAVLCYTLTPPSFFSSPASVGNEVSHPAEQLGIIQNWGALFFCPLPCRPRPADLLPLSIVCPVDCVLSARGVGLLWTLYVCAPAYTHYVLQQVAVTFVLGLVFLLRMRGVERMNRNCCEKLI